MPIKQSSLEQKIFYRVAKVIFLILPFLIAAVLFLKGYIIKQLFIFNSERDLATFPLRCFWRTGR